MLQFETRRTILGRGSKGLWRDVVIRSQGSFASPRETPEFGRRLGRAFNTLRAGAKAMGGAPSRPPRPRSLGPQEAALALLLSPDGRKDNGEWRWAVPIEGKTRLVKELFLIQRETRSGASGIIGFQFTPGPYGPSSIELTSSLDDMIRAGQIGVDPLNSGRGSRLRLTPAGGKLATPIWNHLDAQARSDFSHIKSRIGAMSYKQFLFYVYRAYPEFTENSLIRDEVLSDAEP